MDHSDKTREELLEIIAKLEGDLMSTSCGVCDSLTHRIKCNYCENWYCSEKCGEECTDCKRAVCENCSHESDRYNRLGGEYYGSTDLEPETLKELRQLGFYTCRYCKGWVCSFCWKDDSKDYCGKSTCQKRLALHNVEDVPEEESSESEWTEEEEEEVDA